ncbi:hypothetical protein OPT61_g2785 [Boeremia exigua]|uniref:Uncharacterized protein n=1 Tax=Boeremia exigua TaxID=749465 RepID=A0ACC2IK81_9PLEO|nr:hypothetical protein OPT61_g2785 [Boeremia exigua]
MASQRFRTLAPRLENYPAGALCARHIAVGNAPRDDRHENSNENENEYGGGGGDGGDINPRPSVRRSSPVTDVTSTAIRCYPLAPGTSSSTATISAGDTVGFIAGSSVSHPGPLQFYMARVPSGQTAATWDGSGAAWFKIYEEPAIISASEIKWASLGKTQVSVTVPRSTPSGEYLLRVEHIALHGANDVGGAQFYISCAQLQVQNGGSGTPGPLVSFPGAYKATDPGIKIGIYWPIPTEYKPPGPAKEYREHEDFKCKGLLEPHIRSQNLICRKGNWEWHVKITFRGTMIREDSVKDFIAAQKKRQVRREQLTRFIMSIDFSSLHLVDDTVTELTIEASDTSLCPPWSLVPGNISNLPADNAYRAFSGQLYCEIREDSDKIIYPPLPELPEKSKGLPLSCIKVERDLDAAVSLVHIGQKDRLYVFKSIERPLYQPQDSKGVLTEWTHLSRMGPCLSIARLVATITSGNPYHTGKQEDRNRVFRGFLLEYYVTGSVEAVLEKKLIQLVPEKWLPQIARGLNFLHQNGITHMDVKPSNIVIDTQGNARLIDISGLATSYEWLAPDMRTKLDPSISPWDNRVLNDVWAFGKVASEFLTTSSGKVLDCLHEVVNMTMKDDPSERATLSTAIVKLEERHQQHERPRFVDLVSDEADTADAVTLLYTFKMIADAVNKSAVAAWPDGWYDANDSSGRKRYCRAGA